MNKFRLYLLMILLVILAACGSTDADTSGEKSDNKNNDSSGNEETLAPMVGLWTAETHPFIKGGTLPWIEYVTEETEGRVEPTYLSGGVLGSSDQVIQDVSGGVYDIGVAFNDYWSETVLYQAGVADLPFAFSNSEGHLDSYNAMKKYVEEFELDTVYDEVGVKFMSLGIIEPTIMLSKSPIRAIDDLKGKKVRVPSTKWVPIVESWGATPVSPSYEEIYTALERGMIDVAINAPIGAVANKWYEPAPYVTKVNLFNMGVSYVMNQDFFDSLPEDLQGEFEEEYNWKVMDLTMDYYVEAIDEAFAELEAEVEGKGEMIELTDEQLAPFIESGRIVWENWIEEANERGYDGNNLINGFLEILKDEGIDPPYEFN